MGEDQSKINSFPTDSSANQDAGIPKNKCPICLETILHLAISYDCNHSFCFGCIIEWIRQHNKCPLCRRIIQNIRHNYRSENDFDIIEVMPPTFHEEYVSRISANYFFVNCPEQTGMHIIVPARFGRNIFYSTRFVPRGQSLFLRSNPGTLFVLPEDFQEVIRQLENANIFPLEIPFRRHYSFLKNHKSHH